MCIVIAKCYENILWSIFALVSHCVKILALYSMAYEARAHTHTQGTQTISKKCIAKDRAGGSERKNPS